jgi:hypothetical protein
MMKYDRYTKASYLFFDVSSSALLFLVADALDTMEYVQLRGMGTTSGRACVALFLPLFVALCYVLVSAPEKNSQSPRWILALNTPKSSYLPGEDVPFAMSVVNDKGQTVCDADLTVTITDPEGKSVTLASLFDNIVPSANCKDKTITEEPDYSATFTSGTTGTYRVLMIANTPFGTQTLQKTFQVIENASVIVTREGAMRLYPITDYEMRILVEANESIDGELWEAVPESFGLTYLPPGAVVVTGSGSQRIVHFPLKLGTGAKAEFRYRYQTPAQSPAEYTLGPLRLMTESGSHLTVRTLELHGWQLAVDAVSNSGTIIYGDATEAAGSDDNMNFRTYTDPTTVGGELTTVETADTNLITYAKVAAAPTREERIAVHLKATGRLDILTCTTGCNAAADWTLRGTYATATSDANAENMMAFDVAYEQLSGRAMVVFTSASDGGDAYYCLWNGSSWSPSTPCAATFLPDSNNQIDMDASGVTGQPEWIRIKTKGERLTSYRSDEMLLGISDSNDNMFLAHWTGSAWDDAANPVDDLSIQNVRKFDLAWEETTGEGLAVFTDDSVANLRYSIYTTSWSAAQTDGPANNGGNQYNRWIEMANDPLSDDIAIGTLDGGEDTEVFVWTGAGFTEGTDDVSSDDSVGKNIAVGWTRLSQRAIWLYTDATALTSDMECWTSGGGFVVVGDVGSTNISNSDDVEDIVLSTSPNNNRMLATRNDIDDAMTGLTYSASTGCADGDWTTLGQLNAGVEGHADGTVGTAQLVHGSVYTPYSPWSLNWRFYDDETVDDPSIGLNGAEENTTPTNVDKEEIIRLRVNVAERGGMQQTDTRKKLQYTSDCTPNGTGGEILCSWTDVGDTTETSAVWRYATSLEACISCLDGGTSTTTRLTGSNQTGPAVIRVADKDGSQDTDFDHKAQVVVEFDFPLKAESVVSGTTYYFRLYEPTISSVGQDTAVFREQDRDGNSDCASAACTYPSLTITPPVTANITGTVYSDEGITPLTGVTVAASLNGGTATTDAVDTGGQYTITSLAMTGGSILALYLENASQDAVTVTLGSGSSMTGVHLYQDHLIVRGNTGGTIPMTNNLLDAADANADSDIKSIYSIQSDGALQMAYEKELWVWVGHTFTPGNRVRSYHVTASGTLTMGTNGLVASGSLKTRTGTFTTSTGVLLTSIRTSQALSMGSNSFQNLIIDNGLLGYWKFDDGVGVKASDNSQYKKTGTLTGLTQSAWQTTNGPPLAFYNQSFLDFPGQTGNDTVSIPDNDLMDALSQLSVCAWVKHDVIVDLDIIATKGTSNGWYFSRDDTSTSLRTDTYTAAIMDSADTDVAVLNGATNASVPNVWTHVCFTYRAASTTGLRLYVNGVEDANSPVSTSTISAIDAGDLGMSISKGSEGDEGFNGQIDDFRVYGRVLTLPEIKGLSRGGKYTGSGSYVLGSNLDVNGNLEIFGGALDPSASNYNVNVAGNATIQGELVKRTGGTFTLDSTDAQTLSGSSVFHHFTATALSPRTLNFDHSSRQSVSGALTLRGVSLLPLSLRSTRTGSASNLLLDSDTGSQTIDYLDVKDNDASGGATLVCLTTTEGCTDSGNNTNWQFEDGAGSAAKHWGRIWLLGW